MRNSKQLYCGEKKFKTFLLTTLLKIYDSRWWSCCSICHLTWRKLPTSWIYFRSHYPTLWSEMLTAKVTGKIHYTILCCSCSTFRNCRYFFSYRQSYLSFSLTLYLSILRLHRNSRIIDFKTKPQRKYRSTQQNSWFSRKSNEVRE